jgi:diguanylate cyclase (GGDEF)-like protein
MDMTNENCNKNWIVQSPFPMMATDETGLISWVNPAFEDLCAVNADELIGTSTDNPPSPNLKALLSTANPIQLIHPERGELWLQRTVKQVSQDDEPVVLMHYFQEMNTDNALLQENLLLKKQVENLTLTDELTGMANERSLSQHLAAQVTRSRRYNNPLTLVLVSIEINDQSAHILDEHYNDAIVALSHFLRERLRWADFIARCNAGRFVIVLPETGKEEATRLFNDIVHDKDKIDLTPEQKAAIELRFGLAEWEKGNDPRLLVERASRALD